MENRDRDKMSRKDHSKDAVDVNEDTWRKRPPQSESSASFGQKIGRSEDLNEPSGRVGSSSSSSGLNSSSGRSSGSSSGVSSSGRSSGVSGSRRGSSDEESSIDSGRRGKGSMNSSGKDDSHEGRH